MNRNSPSHPLVRLTIAATLFSLAMISQTAFAESGCPSGFKPDGNERLSDSTFTSYANFNTDIPFKAPIGDYPTDGNGSAYPTTGIGLMNGDYDNGGLVKQIAFPGDGDAPATPTWFAYNGNDDGAPTKMWEQQITGLTPNKDYAFTAYFSNALVPGHQAQDLVAPLVGFYANGALIDTRAVCDAGGGLDPADQSCANEATEDRWNRLGVTVHTDASGTMTLAIHDAQIKSPGGNDFAMTLISFQECAPIAAIVDSDNDGIADNVDIDDDNDGIKDTDEGAGDFDGDGIPNRLDLDSDNDGLPDIVEALGTDSNNDGRVDNFTDANGDGYHDPLVAAPWAIPDTDGDGARDFLDLDSDNDGLFDTREAGMTDANGDGKVDDFSDPDGDGWDANAQTVLGAAGLRDNNGDGTPDYRQTAPGKGEIITRIDGGIGAFGLPALLGLSLFGLFFRRRGTALAALLGLLSVSAHADQGQFYLGGGIGASRLEPEVINLPISVNDKNDLGYKLFLGYDILDWLSLEGYASQLGSAGFSNGGSIDYALYGGNLVATLPQNTAGLSFLGKLGLADISNSGHGVDFREVKGKEFTAGLGAEYHFSNDFSVRGEYEYFDKDARLLSLSLLKRFGGAKPVPPPPPPPPAPAPKPAPKPVEPPPPAPEPPPVVETIKLHIEPIFFDTDSYALKPEATARLDRVAELMTTYPEVSLVVIGHTDSRASDDYNMVLSLNRAKAAVNYLTSRGIDGKRLDYEARGEKEPVADNSTPEGRARNRRVEFFPTPDEVERAH